MRKPPRHVQPVLLNQPEHLQQAVRLTVDWTTRILVLGSCLETDVPSVVDTRIRHDGRTSDVEQVPDDGVELGTDDIADCHFVLADPDLEEGVVVVVEGGVGAGAWDLL